MPRPRKPIADLLIQRSIRMPSYLWGKIDAHGLGWLRALIQSAPSTTTKEQKNGCIQNDVG